MTKRTAPRGNMNVAVAYLRCSTTHQELSPDAQRASIEAWAKANGITVVAWHFDRGVSGGTDIAERPELIAAIGELRAVGAGILVVARRDRLARDPMVAGLIERAVKECGATVLAADGLGNGDDAASQFMRTILDAAAAYERALIRGRIVAALAVKKARGERVGSVPYGFTLAADGVQLVEDEAEQSVIKLVRAARARGLSLARVAAELEAAGIVSRTGKPFVAMQVSRMVA